MAPRKFMPLTLSLLGVFVISVAALAVVHDGNADPVHCFICLPGVGGQLCGSAVCPEGSGCGVTGIDYDNDGRFEEVEVFCVVPDGLGVL
jgi:hypothetical protein